MHFIFKTKGNHFNFSFNTIQLKAYTLHVWLCHKTNTLVTLLVTVFSKLNMFYIHQIIYSFVPVQHVMSQEVTMKLQNRKQNALTVSSCSLVSPIPLVKIYHL